MANPSFWYFEDPDGAFGFVNHQSPSTLLELSIAIKVAASLNDIACARGRGRVYAMVSNRRPVGELQDWTARMRVPELFYVAEPWTEAEKAEWRSASWQYQVSRSCAQNGWLEDQCVILPFRITVHNQPLSNPRFDALAKAPVTVYLAPHPYIGLSKEMDRIGVLGYYQDERREAGITRFTYTVPGGAAGWAQMQWWRVANVAAVVDELDRLFWVASADTSPLFFGSLRRDFLDAAEQAELN